jgi:FkbM family methyltransferase
MDLRRVNFCTPEAQLGRQLSVHNVDVVFDVGANTGQFAERLREAGFRGRIVSFEPSSSAHSALKKRAQRDPKWIVAPRMALGKHDGTTVLYLAGNSASSSLLPMLQSHVNADPTSHYIGSESADLKRLDTVGRDFAPENESVFLKLDVQGFGDQVLQGAEEFLRRVAGIQIELSLIPLYDGELLFTSMLQHLDERGYRLWNLIPGLLDPKTSRLLQVDAVFFRGRQASSDSAVVHADSVTATY